MEDSHQRRMKRNFLVDARSRKMASKVINKIKLSLEKDRIVKKGRMNTEIHKQNM